MNTPEYINSGMLEAYVLGALSPEETEEVRQAMARHPEVAAEVTAIEEALFQLAQRQAAAPPAGLDDRIWAAIEGNGATGNGITAGAPEATVAAPAPTVLPFTPARRPAWARAAVWVALIGSLVANAVLLSQRGSDRQAQLALRQQVDTLQQRQQFLAGTLDQYRKEAELMADPGMQAIVMQTTQKDHPMAATIYWNRNKGQAYISVKKLPMPPTGRQYQLWVIAGGKPVDLGVLPNDLISTTGMQQVGKAIADGQAFAISLEQEGGSPQPTMDQIFVMGKVAS